MILKECDEHTGRCDAGIIQCMSKVTFSILTLHADSKSPCLCVSEVGAGTYLKILLLSRGPCLDVQGFHLQVCQVAGAAFQRTDRDLKRTEIVYRILPEPVIPHIGVFRLADYNHLLLFKLMDPVYASLLDSVGPFFLPEAGRIACQCIRKILFIQSLSDKFADHGMLGGSDQIEIFPFDFIHHGVHLGEGHNAVHNCAADHIRRNAVSKAAVDHEISCVGQACGMESRDIPHQIIESVSGHTAGGIHVNAVKLFHNIRVIGNFIIGNYRIAVFLDFHVLGIVFSDRYRGIDDIRDNHHVLFQVFLDLSLLLRKSGNAVLVLCYFRLGSFRFFFFPFMHQLSDTL